MMKIQIRVKPNARESSIQQLDNGTWFAQLKSPPVDGKANAELCGLVARQFGVSKSQISIKSGAAGRVKLIEIADLKC
jgi:uncharacterized protein (TIGR00251 family)